MSEADGPCYGMLTGEARRQVMAEALVRLWRCERGTAAIEFAMIGMILIGVALGTVEFGRWLQVQNQLNMAADLAAREALVHRNRPVDVLAQNVRGAVANLDARRLTIDIRDVAEGAITYRVIRLEYPITLILKGPAPTSRVATVTRRVPRNAIP